MYLIPDAYHIVSPCAVWMIWIYLYNHSQFIHRLIYRLRIKEKKRNALNIYILHITLKVWQLLMVWTGILIEFLPFWRPYWRPFWISIHLKCIKQFWLLIAFIFLFKKNFVDWIYQNWTYHPEIMECWPSWTPSWISQNAQWCQLDIIRILQKHIP